MQRRGLMFLLLSGCMLVCHLQSDGLIRRFHAIGVKKNWTEAQRYCREKFTDLATIEDPTHNTEAQQAAGGGQFWIGLFNSSWKWSQEDREVSMGSCFTNWATNEPRLKCVTISEFGSWFTKDCGARYYPMCYSADSNTHILVTQIMNWSDAQTYCRSMYTDLSSIRSLEDNQQISSLLQGGINPSEESVASEQDSGQDSDETNNKDSDGGTNSNTLNVWIGLHRHPWMWSDRSNASYRRLAAQQSDDVRADCVKMDSTADWYAALCSVKHFFLCHTDVRPSVLRSVRVQLNRRSDLNDPTLQDAILQQLKQKLGETGIREEVKLRWTRQPDGKIFHREEEEERTPYAEETVCDSLNGKPGID